MCRTWYLSLPVGTLVAFSVDAEASVARVQARGVSDTPATKSSPHSRTELEGTAEKKMYVGYVRNLSASSVSIALLASAPRSGAPQTQSHSQTYTARRRSAGDAHNSVREGVEVDCRGMFDASDAVIEDSDSDSDPEEDITGSHPLLTHHLNAPNTMRRGAEALFGDVEVARGATRGAYCSAAGKRSAKGKGKGRRASMPASLDNINARARATGGGSGSGKLTPTGRLPWGKAYAYAPYLRGCESENGKGKKRAASASLPASPVSASVMAASSSSSRNSSGRTHLIVGNLDASGTGRHTWARFTRTDVQSSETALVGALKNTLPPPSNRNTEDVEEDQDGDDISIVINVHLDVANVRRLVTTPAEFEEEVRCVERGVREARARARARAGAGAGREVVEMKEDVKQEETGTGTGARNQLQASSSTSEIRTRLEAQVSTATATPTTTATAATRTLARPTPRRFTFSTRTLSYRVVEDVPFHCYASARPSRAGAGHDANSNSKSNQSFASPSRSVSLNNGINCVNDSNQTQTQTRTQTPRTYPNIKSYSPQRESLVIPNYSRHAHSHAHAHVYAHSYPHSHPHTHPLTHPHSHPHSYPPTHPLTHSHLRLHDADSNGGNGRKLREVSQSRQSHGHDWFGDGVSAEEIVPVGVFTKTRSGVIV